MLRRSPRRFPSLRWLATGLCAAGVPLLALGCSKSMSNLMDWGPAPAAQAAPPGPAAPYTALKPPAATTGPVVQAKHAEKGPAKEAALPDLPAQGVPVTLDSVMTMTEANNAKIAVARERVNERQRTSSAAPPRPATGRPAPSWPRPPPRNCRTRPTPTSTC